MARGDARGARLRDGGLQALLPGGVLVLQRLQRAGRLLRARRARGQQAGRALAARGARQRRVLGRRRRRRAARRRARRRRGARRRRACARALAIAGRCANGRGCAVRATKLWDVRAALVRATGGGSSIGLSGAKRARRCSPPAGGKPLLLNLWRLFGDVSRSAQPIPGMSTHWGRDAPGCLSVRTKAGGGARDARKVLVHANLRGQQVPAARLQRLRQRAREARRAAHHRRVEEWLPGRLGLGARLRARERTCTRSCDIFKLLLHTSLQVMVGGPHPHPPRG